MDEKMILDSYSDKPWRGPITKEDKRVGYKSSSLCVNKITYDTEDVLGTGSGGTRVCRGMFGIIQAAVKQISDLKDPKEAETEIKRLSELKWHRNVIGFHGHSKKEGFFLLALELADGTLDDWVHSTKYRKKFPNAFTKRKILKQVTTGLKYLHDNNIVHRDLKPKNILLTKADDISAIVKISDFGISVLFDDDRTSKTFTSVGGTAEWMAPEVLLYASRLKRTDQTDISYKATITNKVDIFSLGCVFYFVLTNGGHPFGNEDQQYYIKKGRHFMKKDNLKTEERLIVDQNLHLLETMISTKPSERPDCQSILFDEILWKSHKALQFLVAIGDIARDTKNTNPQKAAKCDRNNLVGEYNNIGKIPSVKNATKNIKKKRSNTPEIHTKSTTKEQFYSENLSIENAKQNNSCEDAVGKCVKTLEKAYQETICHSHANGWFHYLSPQVQTFLQADDNYKNSHMSVIQLVRILRNFLNHFDTLPVNIQKELGSPPDEYFKYWRTRFPLLLFHAKDAFRCQASNGKLSRFYGSGQKENEKCSSQTIMSEINAVKNEYFSRMNNYLGQNVKYHELRQAHNSICTEIMKRYNADDEVKKSMEKCFLKYKEKNDLVSWSFSTVTPAIGIDFGLTYCRVATYLRGEMHLVKHEYTENTIFVHSYVRVNKDGSYSCGPTVKPEESKYPETTIYNLKRLISPDPKEKYFEDDLNFYPFSVEKAGVLSVNVNDEMIVPESFCAGLLKYVRDEAARGLQCSDFSKISITVPTSFDCSQRQSVLTAGRKAGFSSSCIIDDTLAVAMAYRMKESLNGKESIILIYDLGGGTFNVSIVKMWEDKIEVMSKNGDAHLGGEDFDRNIMLYCVNRFHRESGINLLEDIQSSDVSKQVEAKRRLRLLQKQCEEGRRKLMNTDSTRIFVPKIVGDQNLGVEVTARTFEEINMSLFQKTIKLVKQTLEEANLIADRIDEVILVGVLSGTPKIKKLLKEILPKKIFKKKDDQKREHIVAFGAAAYSATLCCFKPQDKKMYYEIQDITSWAIGIEYPQENINWIIPENTKIPAFVTKEFTVPTTTCEKSLFFPVVTTQLLLSEYKHIGNIVIEKIPLVKSDEILFHASFTVDSNGILIVRVSIQTTEGFQEVESFVIYGTKYATSARTQLLEKDANNN